jgi:hypothetical protein
MKNLAGLSFEKIAYVVCTAFEQANVTAVLVGGGAATFYAARAYQTRDLDFVLPLELFGMPKASILHQLGFIASNAAGTYEHPDTTFTLEILQGPLGIGDEAVRVWDTLWSGDLVLHVISPTNSVKDRLASAIHFKDLSAARQAAEIAKLHPVDMEAVKTWCEREGGMTTFALFASLYQAAP